MTCRRWHRKSSGRCRREAQSFPPWVLAWEVRMGGGLWKYSSTDYTCDAFINKTASLLDWWGHPELLSTNDSHPQAMVILSWKESSESPKRKGDAYAYQRRAWVKKSLGTLTPRHVASLLNSFFSSVGRQLEQFLRLDASKPTFWVISPSFSYSSPFLVFL